MYGRLALFLFAAPLMAQPIGVQIKGGIPLTDFNEICCIARFDFRQAYSTRYLVGPAFEVRLSRRFAIEADLFYQRVHLRGQDVPFGFEAFDLRGAGNVCQVPVLAKYRILRRNTVPFLIAGPAAKWGKFDGTIQYYPTFGTPPPPSPFHGRNAFVAGLVLGGGLDFHLGRLKTTFEMRYQRFGNLTCSHCDQFSESFPGFNPVVVMLGVGF